MASTKGRVLNLLGNWLLTEAQVLAVQPIGERFVHLELQGDPEAPYEPGCKVQIMLPSQDVRTYTPIGWEEGRFELLIFRHHSSTPAMQWIKSVQVGDVVRFMGPQRSLTLPNAPLTFFGDETAIAVAAAYRRVRPTGFDVVLEVSDRTGVQEVLERCQLTDALVVERSEASHPRWETSLNPENHVGLAGGGAFVQRIRAQLRGYGLTQFKLKTYWLEGRAGLD